METQLLPPLALTLDALLALLGLRLLWTLHFSPKARASAPAPLLTPWDSPLVLHIALFLWMVLAGGILFQVGLIQLIPGLSGDADLRLIVAGAGFQIGMLLGCLCFIRFTEAGTDYSLPRLPVLRAGTATFLLILPLVFALGLGWHMLLEALGIPVEKQDLVSLFQKQGSPALIAMMVLMAVVIAPVTEELIFRAGLFRYLRTRTPRWVALLVPAVLFGALHTNLSSFPQLVLLGVVFSLAYERTGNIGVPMFAHCLFNLNSVLLLLAGVEA